MAVRTADSIRVIATDVQERSMLAAVRCLRHAGSSVTAVSATWDSPGLWSWTPSSRCVAPSPRDLGVEQFIDRLEQIVRGRPHDILLPGTDASLLAVSRARHRLSPYVRLGLPSQDAVELALNRERFGGEAAKVGLAPPEAQLVTLPEDAVTAARSLGYPVFVKPRETVVEVGGVMRRRASLVARDAAEVHMVASAFGACIVQRPVEGHVVSFGGVATETGLIGCAISRYARTWPPDGGNVSFSETIASPSGLIERVEALALALGWQGLFEVELIELPGGGFAAIDFNPRAYGSMGLAVAAGAPLPALWCASLMGGDPAPVTARAGVRYRWDDAELRHVLRHLRAGRVPEALEVARPLGRVTHAYWQLRDPAPAVARGLQLARRATQLAQVRVNGASSRGLPQDATVDPSRLSVS